ncbi:hypothetical protein CC85DRAFT_325949 [Cutaneotrichosporon oleaginosum]|uniref:Fanconi-associated nuclease n=1 Tax=Cutaneotrichosporon oleaginosum TaxID=879819 RepID=A0A0J0XVE9_9TREE|nr:uncharacterized protein CC85DRAFT_325949 [Cutaneotrichosporon oleaginosum]KLT45031.1 hypothetical protein CC85DRAFT_325949 [Cutaneotrichosporon oleaginosum]TXT09718.1 hypothetical protein COLE_03652 [Cutaneotrichosporon oleaginosum]
MNTPPPPDIVLPPPESPASKRIRRAASQPHTNDGADTREEDVPEEVERGRESMYVRLFKEMIQTVLEFESYLFSPQELWVLKHIIDLPYDPLYLLTRLLLRRRGKVHPIASIAPTYSGELGEEGVKRAARTLCERLDIPDDILEQPNEKARLDLWGTRKCIPERKPSASRRPWTDLPTGLSADEERADPDLAEAIRQSLWAEQHGDISTANGNVSASGASSSGTTTPAAPAGPSSAPTFWEMFENPYVQTPVRSLAHDESELTLDDIMSCVSADDLRRVARARKVPPQLLVTRESVMKALRSIAHNQTTLSFTHVDRKGKGKARPVGSSTRVTSTSERLLLAQLMPCLGGHVIQIDPSLYTLISRVNLIFSRTPPISAYTPALLLPPILVSSHRRRYPDYGTPTRSVIWRDRGELLDWEHAVHYAALVSEVLGDNWAEQRRGGGPVQSLWRGQPLTRTEGAKLVRRVWENVWPQWKEIVAGKGGEAVDEKTEQGALASDRFRTAHVLTRIVAKGADALGVLHEYDLECEVLRALLRQRRWRRGKRGAWYDRLALVLMTHYKASEAQKLEKMEEATQVCIDGLLDPDTHLIYRPRLSHRLTRLENRLNLPADERHISYAQLLKCETRELVAVRSQQNIGMPSAQAGTNGRRESADLGLNEGSQDTGSWQQVGKSAWAGRDGEVTVEGWVLEWWEDRGYEGYHAESSILTTLFALLMWPVLFHPLPGAFETYYQTAPLDLGEDTFARARASMIEERLTEMESTDAALAMLRETDKRERERGTWAVGLSWDFGQRELEEILTCMGGHAMALICRMLSEEYRYRASGVPDLIVWDYARREARFVEVKGPGDSLSDTQKIWIDVLLSAGVPVEVCRVKAKEDADGRPIMRTKRTDSGKSKRAAAKAPEPIVVDDSEEDEWTYESGDEGKPEGRWARPGELKRRK